MIMIIVIVIMIITVTMYIYSLNFSSWFKFFLCFLSLENH